MKMKKIEMIHNEVILDMIKTLISEGVVHAHTTLQVDRAHGPNQGAYRLDYITGTQYYTFVVLEESEAEPFLVRLKEELPEVKMAVVVTDVEVPPLFQ